jgi:hypothetical protein
MMSKTTRMSIPSMPSRIRQRLVAVLTVVAAVFALALAPAHAAAAEAEARQTEKSEKVGGAPDNKPADDPAEVQRQQQIKQQTVHWEQQFTKLLHSDLELIRSVCRDLPRESRRAIIRDGERATREAAARLVEEQYGRGKRQPAAGLADRQAANTSPDDPLTLISAALARSLAEHVGDEQAAALSAEFAARAQRRKAAAVRAIVAALDAELFLTASQRQQIEQSLDATWNNPTPTSLDSLEQVAQGMNLAVNQGGNNLSNNRRLFAGLPDDCVRPHLTESQQKAFAPQPPNAGPAPGQRQAWIQTITLLQNLPASSRDPWWFQ